MNAGEIYTFEPIQYDSLYNPKTSWFVIHNKPLKNNLVREKYTIMIINE